ncbi:MAG TPA: hypothetical protein VK283_02435, partial [Acidimicrobiales bacterium]|nr:hypothetical protein [Acidimicrobiales bacterium]
MSRPRTGTTPPAREALVDSRAKDADARLAVLEGTELAPVPGAAAGLLAIVVCQDVEEQERAQIPFPNSMVIRSMSASVGSH